MARKQYITGTGQHLNTHPRKVCRGRYCVIHHPSSHHMLEWPTHWREDASFMERICPHGIGHPDPDDLAYRLAHEANADGVHGCDGCCSGTLERIGDASRVRCACGARSEQESAHFVGDQCAACARIAACRRFGVGVSM